MNDLVSVIMPVYKVKEELLCCSLNSVLKQTYQNIEILLIDDGSPDDCGKICDKYASKDKRIKVFHTNNNGVSAARNLGLDYCNGKYITFIDSDDYISKSYLENLYLILMKTGASYAKGGCEKVYMNKLIDKSTISRFKCVKGDIAIQDLCYMNVPYIGIEVTAVWGNLYRIECIRNVRFNTKMLVGEDFEFNFRVLQNTNRIVYLNSQEYGYFIHDDSAMRNGFNKKKVDTLDELEKLIQETKKTPYADGIVSRAVNIAIVILLMIPIHDAYKLHRNKILCFLKKYRFSTLKNKNTRKKVKGALLISYLGIDFMQKVHEKKMKGLGGGY